MHPKKIVIIRNDHIGDLILSSCVFRELKMVYPKAKITAVVSDSNRPLIEKNRYIKEIVVIKYGRSFFKKFNKNLPLLLKLRKERFDLGIDLRGDIVNSFILFFIGAKYKIGLYRGFLSNILLNFIWRRDSNKHESVNMIEMINKALNLNIKNNLPLIETDKNDKKELNEFILKNKLKKFICISPEANQPFMQWPLKEFDKIIKFLKKEYRDYKIILTGVDDVKLDWLSKRNPGIINLRRANLRMVYLLFKKSNLVLGLDTGTTHLAWAGDSKLIAVLMPISERVLEHTKPLGKNSRWVTGNGKIVKADRVIKEIRKVLGKVKH